MTIKRKILAFISLLAITIVLLMVGVWAVKTSDFNVGGNISFSTTGINATISKGVLVNGTLEDSADKMKEIVLNTDKTQAQIEQEFLSWQNLELLFNEKADDVTITFTITNDSKVENEYLKIAVTINQGTQANATASINVANKLLKKDQSQQFVITFTVTDKKANASLSGFEINFNMQLTNSEIGLKHDTTNDYYYVEMGTYNSQPVKWKVVGVNGSHYTYNENIAPSGELTFLLETLTTSHEFGYYKYLPEHGIASANDDYATSAIRQYITGHDCALTDDGQYGQDYQVSGNYLEDINLDTTDVVYTKIKERGIQDLYKKIHYSSNSVSDGSTRATGSDKFWLPSVAEIYTIVGGGDLSTFSYNIYSFDDNWPEYQDKLKWNSVEYWLRSPQTLEMNYNRNHASYIRTTGAPREMGVGDNAFVRPAFILEI